MNNPLVLLSNKYSCWLDSKKDRKISGRNLGVFVPTPYAKNYGSTGSQSVPYPGIKEVLKDLTLMEQVVVLEQHY